MPLDVAPATSIGCRVRPCDRYPREFREKARGEVVGEHDSRHWLVLWDGRKEPEALFKDFVVALPMPVMANGSQPKGKRKSKR